MGLVKIIRDYIVEQILNVCCKYVTILMVYYFDKLIQTKEAELKKAVEDVKFYWVPCRDYFGDITEDKYKLIRKNQYYGINRNLDFLDTLDETLKERDIIKSELHQLECLKSIFNYSDDDIYITDVEQKRGRDDNEIHEESSE